MRINLSKYGARFIPLKQNKKIPAVKIKGRTFSRNELTEHVRKGGNIGMLAQPCFIFLDIDVSHGVDGLQNFKKWLSENSMDIHLLDKTLSATTATGGLHYIFRTTKSETFHQDISFLDGVDIKASTNNYIVIAPSKVNGKRYVWNNNNEPILLPSPLMLAIKKQEITNAQNRKKQQLSSSATIGKDKNLGLRYNSSFNKQPQIDVFFTVRNGWGKRGERNNNLFLWAQAMRKITDIRTTFKYAKLANKNSTLPLPMDELVQTINSAFSYLPEEHIIENDGKLYVKVNTDSNVSYAVSLEKYQSISSLYAKDYCKDDLMRYDMAAKMLKGVKTIYSK